MQKLLCARKLIELMGESPEPPMVVDGGAHHGKFSLETLRIFPKARILAFEPHAESWAHAMAALAGHAAVEVVNAALGDVECEADFFCGEWSETNSLFNRPDSPLKPYYPQEAALAVGGRVNVVRLERECASRGILSVDLLKLDLQGAEIAALRGAASLLEAQAVKVILIEVVFTRKYNGQPLFWEIWRHLESHGYSFYSLEEIKIGPYGHDVARQEMRQNQWNQADALFISPSLRTRLDG